MSKLSPSAVLTAGGLAGMACWMVSIPADVLKSRYQTAPDGMYRGLWDVYTKLMKEEGAAGLFTGIRPALIRAFPANAGKLAQRLWCAVHPTSMSQWLTLLVFYSLLYWKLVFSGWRLHGKSLVSWTSKQ